MSQGIVRTIVQTSVDADHGFFPDPFAWGSYLDIGQARKRLAELVAEAKETLNPRYDKEERTDDCWEAYADGYAAGCFLRIEILTSELFSESKGGPRYA